MLKLRKADERGHFAMEGLDSRHTFSFGDYYDPHHIGFRSLRVINDDQIAPAQGFPTHPHRDMEIITYVLDGALEHKDSMGTGAVLRYGDVQVMSAGRGVTHSEFNHSSKSMVRLLQIWINPDKKNLQPEYHQKRFSDQEKQNRMCLLGSRDASAGSLGIHQDVKLFAAILDPGRSLEHVFSKGRAGWLQVARGSLEVNGLLLGTGDGLAVEDERELSLRAIQASEFLLFDLG